MKFEVTTKAKASGQKLADLKTPKSILDYFKSESFQKKMGEYVRSSLTGQEVSRALCVEMIKNPALYECDIVSIMDGAIQVSRFGLELGGLGQAYLVPYGNGKSADGRRKAQLVIGYKGMITLAGKAGISITSRAVYENDFFEVDYGLEERLVHKPTFEDRGKAVAFYAIATLPGGQKVFDIMSVSEINRVRQISKSGERGPWVTHFDEMAKKTVVRRLFKTLPLNMSSESKNLAQAIAIDERDQYEADGLMTDELMADEELINAEVIDAVNQ